MGVGMALRRNFNHMGKVTLGHVALKIMLLIFHCTSGISLFFWSRGLKQVDS